MPVDPRPPLDSRGRWVQMPRPLRAARQAEGKLAVRAILAEARDGMTARRRLRASLRHRARL